MDRTFTYPGSIPLDTDILQPQKNAMVGLGWLAQAILGTSVLATGLGCVPTGPATLNVQINPGAIFAQGNTDTATYGSLGADTTHQLMREGLLLDAATLSCPAPGTAGQSINYLIEAQYQDIDDTPVVLPYYNAANPSLAWSGPNNTGVPQNTFRRGKCAVQVKAGTAATTGTQVTPAADAGWTGFWVVTVANGQSTITAPNIAALGGAPLITETLTTKISAATAGALYAPISTVGLKSGTPLFWPNKDCPAWALTRDGSAMSRVTYPALYAALCPIRNGTMNNTTLVTGLSSTVDFFVGMPVEGVGISAATTVAQINSASSITLSATATVTATNPLTFFPFGYGAGGNSTTFGVPDDREVFERGWASTGQGFDQSIQSGILNATTAVTGLTSTVGLRVGMVVAGTNITGGTTVAQITGLTTLTLSAVATGSITTPLTFTGRSFGSVQADTLKSHLHTWAGASSTQHPNSAGTAAVDAGSSNTGATGDAETRPRNRAYLPIIVF